MNWRKWINPWGYARDLEKIGHAMRGTIEAQRNMLETAEQLVEGVERKMNQLYWRLQAYEDIGFVPMKSGRITTAEAEAIMGRLEGPMCAPDKKVLEETLLERARTMAENPTPPRRDGWIGELDII